MLTEAEHFRWFFDDWIWITAWDTSNGRTSVSVCFRGISRLPSAFVFLRWFKLARIFIQVCTFHDGCKQGIDQQIFNSKSISGKITHLQSENCKQSLRVKRWKAEVTAEKKQTQDYNQNFVTQAQNHNKLRDVKNTSGDKKLSHEISVYSKIRLLKQIKDWNI